MPSTRRDLLVGAAGAVVALAGCNESSSDGPRTTVTPVDVPVSSAEALAEAAEIESPSIPGGVLVTDDHLAAAIADARSLVSDLRSALDRSDEAGVDLRNNQRRLPNDPRDVVTHAESRLEDVEGMKPSEEALARVEGVVHEVSHTLGYVEAELGEIDRERLENDIAEAEAAVETLADAFGYRVVDPPPAYLPTLRAAETALPARDALDGARELLADEVSGDVDETTALALARRDIEVHRRNREDAARLLETATDENRPSVRPGIDAVLATLRDEVEVIADEYADSEPPDGVTVEGELRNIRVHIGRRSRRWRSELADHDGSDPLGLLFDVSNWLVEFESLDAAVARTTSVIEDGEVPAEAIVAAKRSAVESLGEVADGTALQRELAARASVLVGTADRNAATGADVRRIARTHLLYAATDEWATSAMDRGADIAAELQAQQS